jgi:hypothetical protein
MYIKPEHVGPNFEATRKKDYQMHVHRMSEIMKRPVHIYSPTNPESSRHSIISEHKKSIDTENQRMFERLI